MLKGKKMLINGLNWLLCDIGIFLHFFCFTKAERIAQGSQILVHVGYSINEDEEGDYSFVVMTTRVLFGNITGYCIKLNFYNLLGSYTSFLIFRKILQFHPNAKMFARINISIVLLTLLVVIIPLTSAAPVPVEENQNADPDHLGPATGCVWAVNPYNCSWIWK